MFRSVLALVILATPLAAYQSQTFVTQLGSSAHESADAAAPDGSGGAYLTGMTEGGLWGTNSGEQDAWVARVDSLGAVLWSDQFGSSQIDSSQAAAPDGTGGVFIAGNTWGTLGTSSAGKIDAWLARYDGQGNRLWLLQFGTAEDEVVFGATPDGLGGVFLTGHTSGELSPPSAGHYDAWIGRFSPSGTIMWLRQFGATEWDSSLATCADGAGGAFIAGFTFSSLGSPHLGFGDAWIARFDGIGNQLWITQLGTNKNDSFRALASDSAGGVYVCGYTGGSLGASNIGFEDVVLAKFDGLGNQVWMTQFGSASYDDAFTVVPDQSGGAFVGGATFGTLAGQSAGNMDYWLARYDQAGNRSWIIQDGSPGSDYYSAAASVRVGGVILCGGTNGNVAAQPAGLLDVLYARYDPAPTSYCSAKANSLGCVPTISYQGMPHASQATGFVISCSNVQNQKPGLLFYTVNSGPQSQPFSCGTLCVTPSAISRTPPTGSGGSPPPATNCSGMYSIDLASFAWGLLGGSPLPALRQAGTAIHCQWWGRDQGFPAPCNSTLSDGLEITMAP